MKNFRERIKKFLNTYIKDDILRRIITNTGYLFSAQGFVAVLSIVRSILEGRLLGAGGLGLLAVISTFSSSINKLTSFRINESVVRFVRKFEEHNQQSKSKAIFKSAILFELLGALVAFILICLLAPTGAKLLAPEWLDEPQLIPWFLIFGLYVLGNFMYDSSKGLLQVFNRFKEIAAVNAVQSIISFLIVGVIFFLDGGFEAILIARIINKLAGALGMSTLAIINANKNWGKGWWKTPISVLKEEKKDLLRFVSSTNISATISLIAKDSESLWIAAFLNTTAVGYFDLARRLIGYMQMPVDHLSHTTYPELSREIANEKWKSAQRILKRGSVLGAVYMTPFILGAVFFGKYIISLYGAEFMPAYPIWLIMLAGYFIVNTFFWNRVGLLALNRPVFPTVVNFFAMLIKVAATFILVPQYGLPMFAGLLSGYYIITVSLAALRVHLDIRQKILQESQL